MDELKFPMFISLNQKKIIIFGAGKVAYRRINTLLLFHACITVISPTICEEIKILVEQKKIQWIKGCYPSVMIDEDAFFVLATTNDETVNEKIYRACKKLGIIVNNAGNQAQCDFFFPAVVKTEDLVVGITGKGNHHKKVSQAAKRIREELKEVKEDA